MVRVGAVLKKCDFSYVKKEEKLPGLQKYEAKFQTCIRDRKEFTLCVLQSLVHAFIL